MKKYLFSLKNFICLFLFCLLLTISENVFAENIITDIIPKGNIGVFEAGDTVEYTLKHNVSPNSRIISYRLTDMSGRLMVEEKLWLKANSQETVLSLDNLKVGWYRIRFYSGTEEITDQYCSAAVVMPYEGRGGGSDSPLCMDLAGQYANFDSAAYNSSWSDDDRAAFSRAMKLAGFGYVRERVGDRDTGTASYQTITAQTSSLAEQGLKILNEFSSGGTYEEDLYTTYARAYNNGRAYRGKIYAWEGANEPDAIRTSLTADMEASVFKASALGILDSNAKAIKISPSMYDYHSTDFMETLMQNGILDYADAINIHSHKGFENKPYLSFPDKIVKTAKELATVYGGGKAVWCTEAGLSCPNDEQADVYDSSQYALAKYAVTSAAESFANGGTDKHFYFLGRYYAGSNESMGIFTKNNMPYSAYSALANMTYHLENGRIKGVLKNLPDGMHGYVFDRGADDVAIIWNEGEEGSYIQLETASDAKIVDLLGVNEEMTYSPQNKMISVKVTDSPVIVEFSEHLSSKNYYTKTYPEYGTNGVNVQSVSDAKRIIVRQRWDAPTIENSEYVISTGKEYKIYLDVCNLSSSEANVEIIPDISDSLEVTGNKNSVTVSPRKSEVIEYTVKIKDSYKRAGDAYISFGGVLGEEKISPSTAKCRLEADKSACVLSAINSAKDASSWVEGIDGTTVISQNGNGTQIDGVPRDPGNFWCFPYVRTLIEETKDSEGLYFKLNVPAEYAASGENFLGRVWVRTYSDNIGFLYDISDFAAGETEYYIPWNKFYMRLAGTMTGVDPNDIAEIAIGFNSWDTSRVRMIYTVSDMSVYTYESAENDICPTIQLSGINNGAVLREKQNLCVSGNIPEGLYNIKVYLNYAPYEDFSVSGDNLTINLSALNEGAYKLFVTGEWKYGFVSRESIDFYLRAKDDYYAEGTFYK